MSLSGVRHRPYWLDDPARPDPLPRLNRDALADLVVVGGGYAGLWAALRATERDPARTVTVLEAGECGGQASGRNGGFVEPSLTHGFGNGLARWPEEMPELLRQGSANLDGLVDTVARYDIDCALGVAATRFAADVCLDLLAGAATERTELSMVRERPLPFPPEPVRWLGIQATRRSMLRADSTGHANLWLTTMDKLGLGFDS